MPEKVISRMKSGQIEVETKEATKEELPSTSQSARVINVIRAHPEGIRLLEIGNELGVDWRSLTKVMKSLVDSGQVEKMDDVYYSTAE